MGLTRQQITMVAVLMAGAVLVVLNQTLLTPALPTIMASLNVSATTVQWLTSGYALVEAVIIPLNAFFLGRFATRKLFIGGMCLFTLGAITCAVAPSFPLLLLGRVMQACATGVVMPTVFTLVLLIFPRENRGAAMGIIGLIISFAPAVGPALSGVLVDHLGWRALFLLVTCLAAVIVVSAIVALKNFEGFKPTSFDVPSIVLLAIGMTSLLYGISTSTSSADPLVPAILIVLGICVLGLFIRRQLKLDNPILRVNVLKVREFAVITAVITLLEGALIGGAVLFPLYVQNALGASATVSGLIMLPGALIGAAFALISGKLFDRYGVRIITVVGSIVLVAGAALYVGLGDTTPILIACLSYTVVCIGLQALITPLNTWGLNALPNSEIPHGNAILSTVEQVGSSLGTAFVVSLTALAPLFLSAEASAQQTSYMGCHLAFIGLLGICILVCLGILVFVRDKKKTPAGDEAEGLRPGIDRAWLVADLMDREPATLSTEASVADAIAIMKERDTSGVTILDGAGAPAGFLSDGDVLTYLSRHDSSRTDGMSYIILLDSENLPERVASIGALNVMRLATKSVITVNASDAAEDAFKTLAERRIKKVPVMKGDAVVGTLSRRNIIKALPSK